MPLLSTTPKTGVNLAPPLPVGNKAFAQAGLVFRRRQFSMVASAPGIGKSLFATNLSIFTKVPTLYFSADTDEWTVRQRACSILTGIQLGKVEHELNDEKAVGWYTDKLHATDHIDWCFSTDLDPEFLVRRINAHKELRGQVAPSLIIVDNLGNTVVDQDNEAAELRATCRELQRIARLTDAHVMALHHVKGSKENGTLPIQLGDLLYNLGKIPEIVLGLHRDGENTVTLTAPKYRGGKGWISVQMPISYETATFGGYDHRKAA